MTNTAKKKLLPNITTNYCFITLNSLIGLWLTPFLIKNLGVGIYGLVPLLLTIVNYASLMTSSIVSSLGRFIAVNFNSGRFKQANDHLNTAFYSLLLLLTVIAFSSFYLWHLISNFIVIPKGYESDAEILFFCTVLSFSIVTIKSPFDISFFLTHRFDIENYIKISSKVILVFIIVLLFNTFFPSLVSVGISYIATNLFLLLSSIFFFKKLTPELRLAKKFSKESLAKLAPMSGWSLMNSTGALLYLSIDLIIINLFLGPEAGGLYAPFVQLLMMISLFIDAISNIFTPIAYEYIAQKKFDLLSEKVCLAIKYIGIVISFPISLLCGLAVPILQIWLGSAYSELYLLMWILIFPVIIIHTIRPVFAINRGLNKIKYPAIVTLLGGICNIILSIYFVKYTSIGIYGVGISTTICLFSKNIFFIPAYSARLLGDKPSMLYKSITPGILLTLLVSSSYYLIDTIFTISNLQSLIACSFIGFIIYGLTSYTLFLKQQDRSLLRQLLLKSK